MPDRRVRALAASTSLALALVGAGAGGATAQHDRVFVDPDSPAGKEYELPFESARRDAAGGKGISGAGGGDAPPAFGAGISPRSGTQFESGGGDSARSPDEPSPQGGGGGSGPGGGAEASEAVAKAVAQSSGGLSAGWLTALIALGVLIVGGVIGLSVRALRGPHEAH